jgi:hypothetical protein
VVPATACPGLQSTMVCGLVPHTPLRLRTTPPRADERLITASENRFLRHPAPFQVEGANSGDDTSSKLPTRPRQSPLHTFIYGTSLLGCAEYTISSPCFTQVEPSYAEDDGTARY